MAPSSRFHRLPAFLAVLAAAALGLGWGQTWEEIRSGAGRIQSVQADFVQEKHMKILAVPLASAGKLRFRMPDALRWEYTEPFRSVLLLSSGRGRRYIHSGDGWAEEGAAGIEAMQVVLGEITHWLNGDFAANPDFTADLSPDRKITLTPKSPGLGRIIERIVLDLSATPGIIDAVTIHEGPGSFTRLTFQAPVLNQPIADAVFQTVE
ncbi:outer membrane lipoprotein carrier protein LolA [Desulfococcus sp.]|uniref:outer membrane lipoprotein carrier protein LolA n=1 Tax=Desulfococcus sp. TaxID=2025834 RepID=UPI00359403A3